MSSKWKLKNAFRFTVGATGFGFGCTVGRYRAGGGGGLVAGKWPDKAPRPSGDGGDANALENLLPNRSDAAAPNALAGGGGGGGLLKKLAKALTPPNPVVGMPYRSFDGSKGSEAAPNGLCVGEPAMARAKALWPEFGDAALASAFSDFVGCDKRPRS